MSDLERRSKVINSLVMQRSASVSWAELLVCVAVIHLNTQVGMPSYVPKRPTMFMKKDIQAGGLADPGWVPMMGGQRQQKAPQPRRYAPMGYQSLPVNRPDRAPQQLSPPPPQPARDRHYEPPAWVGSLRHSGGPRPWEMAEAEHLMAGGAAGYRSPPQRAVGIRTFLSLLLSRFYSAKQLC